MKAALVVLALGGCVTGVAIWKPDKVSIPLLIGAAAADFVVTSVLAAEVEGFSAGGSIAASLAVTGLDVGVGCILGACNALKP